MTEREPTLAEIKEAVRNDSVNTAYKRIQQGLTYLVMVTPTGREREELTNARICLEKALHVRGRARC